MCKRYRKRAFRLLILNGGAKATTLELLITNYVKRIKSIEFCQVVNFVNLIDKKQEIA